MVSAPISAASDAELESALLTLDRGDTAFWLAQTKRAAQVFSRLVSLGAANPFGSRGDLARTGATDETS